MKIIIGGDLAPTKTNEKLFINNKIDDLLGKELINLLKTADYTVFNLESPLTDSDDKIAKCGPHLKASREAINAIVNFPVSIVGLANNHILDYGEFGLQDTIATLENKNIKYIGAGKNISEASKSLIIDDKGIKIGIYACAEHEFSIATEKSSGANPFDPLYSLDHIYELKSKCNFVIVLYHGGKEYYRYPSPRLQEVCRRIIDKGADIVVCQHSHCIGCREEYNTGSIIYGQGNFLFGDGEDEYLNSGIILELELLSKDKKIVYKLKEIPICKKYNGVRLAENYDRDKILTMYNLRSEKIKDNDFILNQYREFSKNMLSKYLSTAIGRNIFIRIFNRIFRYKLVEKIMNKQSFLALQNYLECEAHRELYTQGIKEKVNKYR